MRNLLKFVLYFVIIIIVIFLLFLLYASVTDYKPDDIISVSTNPEAEKIAEWTEYDLMIWNIGYCGLDASMDFFYDGGEQVRPSRENVVNNLDAVCELLSSNDSVEFFLLQEVDKNSKRSYRINEYDSIAMLLDGYHSYFGQNYNVFFVPLPPSKPMGKVNSGLQTLSRYQPSSVDRYSFPGNYGWPMGIFMLDRCFLVSRYPVSNSRELVIINTHNSAYDDGSLRAGQMRYLKDFLLGEYEKGNYILVGGDWNQSPFGFPKRFEGQVFDDQNYTEIEENYPAPGWIWTYDGSMPTNRRVATIYRRGVTPTTIIDFYLLSPNVLPVQVKTLDLDFRNSDHQPVLLKILIRE